MHTAALMGVPACGEAPSVLSLPRAEGPLGGAAGARQLESSRWRHRLSSDASPCCGAQFWGQSPAAQGLPSYSSRCPRPPGDSVVASSLSQRRALMAQGLWIVVESQENPDSSCRLEVSPEHLLLPRALPPAPSLPSSREPCWSVRSVLGPLLFVTWSLLAASPGVGTSNHISSPFLPQPPP